MVDKKDVAYGIEAKAKAEVAGKAAEALSKVLN